MKRLITLALIPVVLFYLLCAHCSSQDRISPITQQEWSKLEVRVIDITNKINRTEINRSSKQFKSAIRAI